MPGVLPLRIAHGLLSSPAAIAFVLVLACSCSSMATACIGLQSNAVPPEKEDDFMQLCRVPDQKFGEINVVTLFDLRKGLTGEAAVIAFDRLCSRGGAPGAAVLFDSAVSAQPTMALLSRTSLPYWLLTKAAAYAASWWRVSHSPTFSSSIPPRLSRQAV